MKKAILLFLTLAVVSLGVYTSDQWTEATTTGDLITALGNDVTTGGGWNIIVDKYIGAGDSVHVGNTIALYPFDSIHVVCQSDSLISASISVCRMNFGVADTVHFGDAVNAGGADVQWWGWANTCKANTKIFNLAQNVVTPYVTFYAKVRATGSSVGTSRMKFRLLVKGFKT